MTVSAGARYMVGLSMTWRVVRCSRWTEVQVQNVGRGMMVMHGVCKKDVFDIPMTSCCYCCNSLLSRWPVANKTY